MAWKVELSDTAAKAIRKLDHQTTLRIKTFINQRLALLDNPRAVGEALHGPILGKFWKYRVSDYRIIVELQDSVAVILVITVGNRREVYRR